MIPVLNRMVLAVAITAVSLVGTSVPTDARQPKHQDQKHEEKQKQHKAQKQERHRQQKAQQQSRHELQALRLSEQQQQQLIHQHRQRLVQYRQHLEAQHRLVHQRSLELQQEKRLAQYRFQQQYAERLRLQQIRIANEHDHNYGNDPYFYTPPSHRYFRGGHSYETNQYGADLLRRAVNNGYEEGFRAGEADREDRWASSYRDSSVYQDANYGYSGQYVERDDYNHYFREGFSRGYEDGYDSRHQYGSTADGKSSILANVLAGILNLEALR